MSARVAMPAPAVKVPERTRPAKPPKVTGKASTDARFQKMVQTLEREARKARQHPTAAKCAEQAQAAAKRPPNEQAADAEDSKVTTMEGARPQPTKTDGFENALLAAIEEALPKDNDQAEDLVDGKRDLTGAAEGARGEVRSSAQEAASSVAKATGAPLERAPGVPSVPIPAEAAPTLVAPDPAAAAPLPKPEAAIDQSGKVDDFERQKEEAHVTDDQLARANDPRFNAVVGAESGLREAVSLAPATYRAGEQTALRAGVASATRDGRAGLNTMVGQRARRGAEVRSRQEAASARDAARRKEVVDHVEHVYERTKTSVEELLSTMEADALAAFERGAKEALEVMQRRARQRISDRSAWSKFKNRFGLDPTIGRILEEEGATFKVSLRELARSVARIVDQRLAFAKSMITLGQAEIAGYVASLPRELQSAGQQAAEAVAARFHELEDGIEQPKQALAQKMAQRYADASKAADDALREIEKENESWYTRARNAIREVVQILGEMKAKLMSALRKGADAILLILAHPIDFLGNLIAAVKGGVMAFVNNFVAHLSKGFQVWLAGELARVGVAPPADLSLPSLLKLVLEVLGLTWPKIRELGVNLVGEPAMKALETAGEFVTAFVRGDAAALWGQIKEQLSDLKSMVVDTLIDWVKTTVVQAGAAKLLSLLTPAGAFVQACLMIYDIIVTVLQRARQIAALVEAVAGSISAIARGAIAGAISAIEGALAGLLPLAITFLAKMARLNKIVDKVVEFVGRIRSRVRTAIGFALNKMVVKFASMAKRGVAKAGGKGNKVERTEEEKTRDKLAAIAKAEALVDRNDFDAAAIRKRLGPIMSEYRLSKINLVIESETDEQEVFHFQAAASKDENGKQVKAKKHVVISSSFGKQFKFSPFRCNISKKPQPMRPLWSVRFRGQIRLQEREFNSIPVGHWKEHRRRYKEFGRDEDADREIRDHRDLMKIIIIQHWVRKLTEDPKMTDEMATTKAIQKAEQWLAGMAVLHEPDQVAGGYPLHFARFGPKAVNSAIGSQWGKDDKRKNLEELDARVQDVNEKATMSVIMPVVDA